MVMRVLILMALFGSQIIAQQAPPGQGQFLPVEQLPPTEQLPAAPLLIAAYAVVWVIAMAYIWSVWRRLTRVEHDMQELEKRQSQRTH
jgi:hypothetical protein